MATTASPGLRRAGTPRWLDPLGLALLAYVPPLLSSPGRVSADSKQYLYLDPAAFLARAPHVWDAQAGAGGVSHQHIGYLWPMGPWFWAFDAIGVPVWIAQRLWIGTLALVAALGARWLLHRLGLSRAGVLAGTLVYLLTPFQLAFTARTSVLLLPWAGLPWLVGCTDRALRDGGWRDPAWIALIVLTIGSVNASSLVLIGLGPLVWLLMSVSDGRTARRAAGVAVRVGLLSLGVLLWSLAALRLEGAYGLPVLHLTENVETVSATSTPSDLLRGLGNWYFYGRDRLGFSIDQAESYLHDRFTLAATFGLAAVGVAAAIAVRWRHRARFAALVLAGTVVGVGAWPLDDPSPYARAYAEFTNTAAGLALRNTSRVAPVIVLGFAGLIGAAVSGWQPVRHRWVAGALIGGLALAGLKPVAETGFLSEHQERVDPIPGYWTDVASTLDANGTDTRVLELPGSNFAAYRWGNAVDPILPGLMTRGHVSREVLPLGSESSALLIDALDRHLQEGTLEPSAIAPIARLLGAGDVVVRADLEYERFPTPNPRGLWDLLTGVDAPGLGDPKPYGGTDRNQAAPELPMVDELELRARDVQGEPPRVAVFAVEDKVPIVRTAPALGSIVLAGDGDGLVEAASAGLVDGRSQVVQATSVSDDVLDELLAGDADVIITDTYRRRSQTWFYAIRDTRGPTERAGETLPEPTGYDVRLDPTPQVSDARRTLVEQQGATVTATAGGGVARPEDRAMAAIDGDPRTAWRVGGADPTGTRWRLELARPVEAPSIVLAQPLEGSRDRWITGVRLHVDDRAPIDVEVTEDSFGNRGQVVELGPGAVRDLEVEITGVSAPPFDPQFANAVGFREITVPGVVVEEWVRVPSDLLERAGPGHLTDLVLTRLRHEPGDRGRLDEERVLRRLVALPRAQAFTIAGTVRIDPNEVDDATLDQLLATDLGGGRISASSRLAGDLRSRASRAVDGDPATMWQSSFGRQDGQAIAISPTDPGSVGDVVVHVVQDDQHSVPGTLTLEADGVVVGTVEVPVVDGGGPRAVELPDPPAGVAELVIRAGEVRERNPSPGAPDPDTLPIAFTEIEGTGIPRAVDAAAIDDACQPLLRVDGRAVPVRVSGAPADARRGLTLAGCEPVELAAGDHAIEAPGAGGFTVDRIVLSSAADGAPATIAARGTPRAEAGASAVVDHDRRGIDYDLDVETDGEPFWLVLGQSDSRGFTIDVDGGTAGARQIVDGYANGWLVTPDGPGQLRISVAWTPQRLIWITLAISSVAVLLCLVLVLRGRRLADAPPPDDAHLVAPPAGRTPLTPGGLSLALAVGAAVLFVSTPLAAVAASLAVVGGLAVPRASWAWMIIAPALVLLSESLHRPELAWVALALLSADLAAQGWQELSRRRARGAPGRPPAPAR